MFKLFALKQHLRNVIARIWPLAFLTILLLFILQPQTGLENRIHTSSLGKQVFGFVNGDYLPGLRDSLQLGLNIMLWLLILLIVTRLVSGFLVSDKRFLRNLTQRLRTRNEVRHVEHRAVAPRISNLFSTDSQSAAVLRYTTISLQMIDSSARICLMDDGYQREGWRLQLGQRTAVALLAPADLPHIHIISKANLPDQNSILQRLRDPAQYFRLEGDFSEVFDVYAARQFELYALQILQPDVMHKLMQACKHIDIASHG